MSSSTDVVRGVSLVCLQNARPARSNIDMGKGNGGGNGAPCKQNTTNAGRSRSLKMDS